MSGPPASTPLGANSIHVPSPAEMEQTFWSHEGSPNAYMARAFGVLMTDPRAVLPSHRLHHGRNGLYVYLGQHCTVLRVVWQK